jgi:hypothetical protein
MSEDPIICPKCGSKNVIQIPDGKLLFRCLDCEFAWDEERIHDVPDEQGFKNEEELGKEIPEDENGYGYGGEEGEEDAWTEEEEEEWFEEDK